MTYGMLLAVDLNSDAFVLHLLREIYGNNTFNTFTGVELNKLDKEKNEI